MCVTFAFLTFVTLNRQSPTDSIEFKEGLAINGVVSGGRVPVGFDSVQDLIVHGKWAMPKAGDSLPTSSGGTAQWRTVKAGPDGSFRGSGAGYIVTSTDLPADRVMDLVASGDSFVYVNGVPRAGDPYSYGYLKLPVALHKGQNTFLIVGGRGGIKLNLTAPRAPVQIETGDLTLPDVIVDGPKELVAGVVLLNNTENEQIVHLSAKNSAGGVAESRAVVPAMTIRKVPVNLHVPDGELGKTETFEIEATAAGQSDKATISLEVKKSNDTHRETFMSNIDGSLQYYGVNPSQNPKKSDALVLTLHGASVEGVGQAAAYAHKDWCTLVAPTNRRPYGFDWEDIGRLDALEVLDIAKKRYPHDPESVHLTGHSMGGHGTWSIGTLYPDLFASIAPSAAWISFWSYAGGYKPRNPTPVESDFVRAMAPSDTLARVDNMLEEKVYVLHGGADDNVPVAQARQMKQVLTDIHADFEYHEQPGAGHWWGLPNMGAACVDWPGIFDQIKNSKLTVRKDIDFTTPNPAVSAHDEWVTVLEQTKALVPSVVKIGEKEGATTNVAALRLEKSFDSLTLDGQSLGRIRKGSTLINFGGKWTIGRLADGAKTPDNSGPFKNVYRNRFMFVIGTHGTPEENAWAAEKARYDAETFEYRGNGSVDIVADSQYRSGWQRNVVLYGNADTNSAWKSLLGHSPIQARRGELKAGDKTFNGTDLAGLFVYPHKSGGKWILVGAITGTGLEGFRTSDRLGMFTSGVAYPDWTILSADVLKQGMKGIKGAGFFGNDWSLTTSDSAWNQ